MLGTALIGNGGRDEAREAPSRGDARTSTRPATSPGSPWPSTTWRRSRSPRRPAPRRPPVGRGPHLSSETGARLADFVEDTVRGRGIRPNVRFAMSDEAERLGAEGRAMTLDEAVAYALGLRAVGDRTATATPRGRSEDRSRPIGRRRGGVREPVGPRRARSDSRGSAD